MTLSTGLFAIDIFPMEP